MHIYVRIYVYAYARVYYTEYMIYRILKKEEKEKKKRQIVDLLCSVHTHTI